MKPAISFICLAIGVTLAGCSSDVSVDIAASDSTTPDETAAAFVARTNRELKVLGQEVGAANWVRRTYITPDTAKLAAKGQERLLAYYSEAVQGSKRYQQSDTDPATARALLRIRQQGSMPAPNDADKRAELAVIATRMQGLYGSGKYCPDGSDQPESCKPLEVLERVLANSRDYDELLDAWRGWRTISPPMRADYQRFAELTREGARELGYDNLGDYWKSKYDMPADAFEQETERLWSQVKPLYHELHCYARARLADTYGEDRVPPGKPIPAHLLGNMWSQQWHEIYDILEPYGGVGDLDVDSALEGDFDAVRMTRLAEDFYISLGMRALPQTFWERSLLTKPRDREVVCHASAWSLGGGVDVRIAQCIEPSYEDLTTLYHELGHVYYYMAYEGLPTLFRTGAHDGFHEAIGDTVVLSMTPAFLNRIGLVSGVAAGDQATINAQLKMALQKIAFLPFGKLIDQWRWDVFSGKTRPEDYNADWWALRTRYQGIAPPVARSEADFDPGAKFHIPGNTPYTRYFLAHILQFQFQRALCDAAGHEGPLHECSIYGSAAAGEPFQAMMANGASQPWQDTLETLTGTREMDASAIIEYFAPLITWLKKQNEGQVCGWDG